ncbi:MAG: tRNA (adenosine(37)-N6)-threonylcarbamoyltransferase complex ATPase subunit type 1 TsaE [Verrucomicrobiota bacterium]
MALTILSSIEASQAFAASWADGLSAGDVLALRGVLGAGKTQLVKGLARGLGFRGDVTSPTFTLIHEYRGGRLPLYHIDLYRIRSEREAVSFGIEEYLPSADGVTVIEWPERIAALLPANTQHWELEVVSLTERVIRNLSRRPRPDRVARSAPCSTSPSIPRRPSAASRSATRRWSCRRSNSAGRSATPPRSSPRLRGWASRGSSCGASSSASGPGRSRASASASPRRRASHWCRACRSSASAAPTQSPRSTRRSRASASSPMRSEGKCS